MVSISCKNNCIVISTVILCERPAYRMTIECKKEKGRKLILNMEK